MAAQVQSALRHRLTVPAWLIAIAIATAFALTVVALSNRSDEPIGQSSATGATTTRPSSATLSKQDTVCVDTRAVGHC